MKVEIHFAKDHIIRDSLFYRKEGKVYSAQDAVRNFEAGNYEKVAEVEATGLEQAWMGTQNIEDAWNKVAPCRSSSVGDIFVVDGVKHIVAAFGFEKLEG